MATKDLLNAIQADNAESIGDAFMAAINYKVANLIDNSKMRIGETLLDPVQESAFPKVGAADIMNLGAGHGIDCVFPTCNKKAAHVIPYKHGSETMKVHVCSGHLGAFTENQGNDENDSGSEEGGGISEVYSADSYHPEVGALIKKGYKLVRSEGGRDFLKGPNGERKVVRMHKGKLHIVSEAKEPEWNESNVDSHPELKRIRDEYEYQEGQGAWGKGYHHHSEDRRYYKMAEGLVQAHNNLRQKLLSPISEEVEQLDEIGDTPAGQAKLHKYITFAKDDLIGAERSKREDDERAERFGNEAKNEKNKDEAEFKLSRAAAFKKSAETTGNTIKNRKKGLSNAAKRVLKSKVGKPNTMGEAKVWMKTDILGNHVVTVSHKGKDKSEWYGKDERGAALKRGRDLSLKHGTKFHINPEKTPSDDNGWGS